MTLSEADAEARERALRLRLEVPELLFVFDLIRERALPQLRAGGSGDFSNSSEFERLLGEARIRLHKTQYLKLCGALEGSGILSEVGLFHIDSLARICQALQGHVTPDEGTAKGHVISLQRILSTISQHWMEIVRRCGALQSSTSAQISEASFASCLQETGIALSKADVRAVWSTLLRGAQVVCIAGDALPSISSLQLHAWFDKQDASGQDPRSSLSAIMRDQPPQRLRKDHTQGGRSTGGAIFPAAPLSSHHSLDLAYLNHNLLPWCETESCQSTNLKERLYCRIMELQPAAFSSFVQCLKTGSAAAGGDILRSVLFQALLDIDVRVGKAEAESVWRQATDSSGFGGRKSGLSVQKLFAWLSKDAEGRFHIEEKELGLAIEVAQASSCKLVAPLEAPAAVEEIGKLEGKAIAAFETSLKPEKMQSLASPSLNRGSYDSTKSLLGLVEMQPPLPPHRFKRSSGITSSDSVAAVMKNSSAVCAFDARVARTTAASQSRTTASDDYGNAVDVRQRGEVVAICCKQRPQMALLFRNAAVSSSTEGVTCKQLCDDLERYLQSRRVWNPPLIRATVWKLVCDMAGVAYDSDSESASTHFLQMTQYLDRAAPPPSKAASDARDHSQLDLSIKNKLFDCRDIKGQRLRLLSLSTILRQRLRTMNGRDDADDCSAADAAKLLESVNLNFSAEELRRVMEQANAGEGALAFTMETSAQLHRIVLCLSRYL